MPAAVLTPEIRRAKIERLRRFPDELEALVAGLSDDELFTPFIPNQMSVAQMVHHMADEHMVFYIRIRLILTEHQPMLKWFDHDGWVKLADYKLPITSSLVIFRNLHVRWCTLLDSLSPYEFTRVGIHTVYGEMSVDNILILADNMCSDNLRQIARVLAAGRAK
ncbi:MAG: metal-dependent hydrolase [Anaerolineaceae bacterium]|nr:metal-dependent hydrolase [Anaerolineaceae bacterium]